jgi:hypothetical protein
MEKGLLWVLVLASAGCMPPCLQPSTSDICSRFALSSEASGVSRLATIDHTSLEKLFYCPDLKSMAGPVPAIKYPDLIKTKPLSLDWSDYARNGKVTLTEEYWDVYWAWGCDPRAFYSSVPGLLKNEYLNMFVYIKKQFPKEEGNETVEQSGTPGRPILGWTTFGFDEEHDALVETTPNRVFSVPLNDENSKDFQILMMKYVNPPWYEARASGSYVDYFRFLTPDVVIARGLRGSYQREDERLPDEARAHLYQQFWMKREHVKRTVNLSIETRFFSTPIIRTILKQSKTAQISEVDLNGEWDVDLIMNQVTIRNHGNLLVSFPGGYFTLSTEDGPDRRKIHVKPGQSSTATVIEVEGDQPLELRKVSTDADVMAGRICSDAASEEEVTSRVSRKYYYFLPLGVKWWFMSQYFEPFGEEKRQFCNYYLLRRR